MKSTLTTIYCLFICIAICKSQNLNINKFSIDINTKYGSYLHYEQPVPFYLVYVADIYIIPEKQYSEYGNEQSINLYFQLFNRFSIGIGASRLEYKFGEIGVRTSGWTTIRTPYKRTRNFLFQSKTVSIDYILINKEHEKVFTRIKISDPKLLPQDFPWPEATRLNLSGTCEVNYSRKIAPHVDIYAGIYFMTFFKSYIESRSFIKLNYTPYGYGCMFGVKYNFKKSA